ncbi:MULTISPECIES: DUF2264 domain-containing protein [unclassified Enterococcus]|uniref:DUF2264 domain-containing protein n=1 Tax=unclassified Enterococcus TaxID=2608891 RepID=UPI001554231D|nr:MULTISPECIES: DUF2264 domain-containing protein [unclassified Enterococcus]MBS7577676.1 DUF2264 domain-containing protein [Enterococcus sp. MMGLQ5-2]MBS7584130.1 DUF2264 domain-containing protein [Enterococcus sp. MMGLQ5-1]NPD11988.1 DUF2264 domain-containing protein [Enterococcus sp. MMGLQ5-1]NPD37509.1 DUF2264 domain-containing protein [Enterococcus sp. MMGLQ5-2]
MKFDSYENLSDSFKRLTFNLKNFYQVRKGRLKLGTHGTVYKEDTRQIEGYLRVLWGVGPYLTQANDSELNQIYLEGITAGTDPDSADYWGDVTDFDQLLVEMASLALTLILIKAKTWDLMTELQQNNLANWLRQINAHTMPDNNWHFFRVIVNIALKKLDVAYSQALIESDLALMDSYYDGEGWYYDGPKTQRDYYIPWGFHYYSLIYATVMAEEDPKRSECFKSRARKFAKSYYHYFDKDGAAIPFGRSLTYRFAQAAFWSALVFADVEALPWGEIKGLYSRNMAYWFKQAILTSDGLLSVGYAYENLTMAEGYNSPGSPYWAYKAFLLLAVPKNHPYWIVENIPYATNEQQYFSQPGRAILAHTCENHHTLMYPFGQSVFNQNHSAAKYSKFVYSTKFGFSVPKSTYHFYESALDSVLSVSEDDSYYRPKAKDLAFDATEDWLSYDWAPYQDVTIHSIIIPCADYHVRVHQINNQRLLFVYDAGFSNLYEQDDKLETKKMASYQSSVGISSIEAVLGYDQGIVIRPEPNTNLLYNRTLLPVLKAQLSVGKHLLISIVGGITDEALQSPKPVVEINNQEVIIKAQKRLVISLDV